MARRPIAAPTRKPILLPPARPNVGVRVAYQARLDKLIDQMGRSYQRAIGAAWRRKPPVMAQDESPAAALREVLNRLGREWEARFAEFASVEGRRFTKEAFRSADHSFAASLKKAGFSIQFKMTAAANDLTQATIAEQVGLIRSIPEQYHTQVQGIVMRGVTVGRDAQVIADGLQHQLGVVKRRAVVIARDQTNKATATITRARQAEIGITEAVWLHSSGGKQPRPEHVAFSGKRYEIAKGAYLEGVWTWPGYEINCRCVSKSVIPGLE